MKILVTGSNGQLGQELKEICAHSTDEYLFTDVDTLDITDREALHSFITQEGVNVIVNCAAYTQVDKAEEDADTAEQINHYAVENLAHVTKEQGATLIHISTDYVFSGNHARPYTEADEPAPTSVYGQTKLRGEEAIRRVGCAHCIIRTAWLYSAFGNNFVKTMRRLFRERESLKVVADQVGTPTYARDLARLIVGIIDLRRYPRAETFHFSNEGVASWYDFAMAIAEMSESDCTILPCRTEDFPTPATRPSYSVLDKTKIKHSLALPIRHWREALKECIHTLNTL